MEVPNTFYLKSAGKIEIRYSSTSIAGHPMLTYEEQGIDKVRTFTNGEIRTQESDIGDLVTVILEDIPDLHQRTLTILMPKIILPRSNSQEKSTNFNAVAIFTTHKTGISPNLVEGAIQLYRIEELEGKAVKNIY